MQVVWTRTALRGVRRAYEYVFDFNPRLRLGWLMRFLPRAIVWRIFRTEATGAGTMMRELVTVSPYIIRDRIAGGTVIILRVRHSARRPTRP